MMSTPRITAAIIFLSISFMLSIMSSCTFLTFASDSSGVDA